MEDIVKNTTFEDFGRERQKMEGELVADLDSPRMKALDNFYKNIYAGHYYSHTQTKILEDLGKITKQDVLDAYGNFGKNSRKVIAFVGDLGYDDVFSQLNRRFGDLIASKDENVKMKVSALAEAKEVEIIKSDLNQAHIIQGWLAPTFEDEDCAALSLLNVILGAGGLSSRLFLELRDKKGLAYVVRSSYEIDVQAGDFSIYIATEPKNIQVSLDGFTEELNKLKTVFVSEEELENAKNNLFGKWAFSQETNLQQAALIARNVVDGLGADYNERLRARIEQVTPQQIMDCVNRYFTDKYVLSIVKPEN
jgi:predicted Zn-dependent peptidase